MKISIQRYIQISIVLISFVFIGISSFYFLDQRAKNASVLLDSLRKESAELSYVLSIKLDSYSSVQKFNSTLARKAANDAFIDAFIIADEHHVLLTTDSQYNTIPSTENVSDNLYDSDPIEILKKQYFKKKILFYENNTKRVLNLYLITDVVEIDRYLNSTLYHALQLFIFASLILSLLVFLIHKRYLIEPLELLRQFAYYQSKIPSKFPVVELEYIRASLVQTFRRLEEEKKELYDLSRIDQLSGLLNRNALFDRTSWLIAEAVREKNEFAVLFLDLDHFKDVNDSLGHKIGDILLKSVAQYLQEVIRTEDFVARIGGDEFVVVINNYESHLELIQILQRLLARIKEPFIVETNPIYVSASIGVVIYPKDGFDMNTLLKHADIAMYEAKRKGRDQYHFFTQSLNQKVQEDIRLDKNLRTAIQNNEFKLYYQPKVDVKSGKIIGSEALIRWFHPEDGMIPPDRFIPLCEHNGFIILLGEWVLKEAAKQQVKWKNEGMFDLPISVNMSSKQFYDDHFMDKFKAIITSSGVEMSKIDIEITEYMLMENSESNLSIMKELQSKGITISLDDFGTGYSSLSYLKKFPMNTLKIDKSFMDDFKSETGAIFIETIVNIGKTVGMSVVAEGVETAEQVTLLEKIGCDSYQGYYCSKAVDADAFALLVKKYNSK